MTNRTVLWYLLCMQLNKNFFSVTPFPQWRGVGSEAISFVITLLFASHPIHTEAVANIKGRDDILDFIFLEISLLCKEMAVTFLAIIPLTVFFFREIAIKKIAMFSVSFVAAFCVYMLIRSSVLDTVTFAEKM